MAGLAWPQEGAEAVPAAAGTGFLQYLETPGPDWCLDSVMETWREGSVGS